ncbi:MAG: hypothetical protein AAF203_02465 [Pseudomonadota bacterium]
MFRILVTLSFLFLTMSGFAAEKIKTAPSKNQVKTKVTAADVSRRLKGFSVVGFWSTADRLPVKVGSEQINAKSEKAFGLGMEYKASLKSPKNPLPLSVIGGLAFESSRELKAQNRSGQSSQFPGSNPSFTMFTFYSNLDYQFMEQVSVFGGINFPFPNESDFGDVSLSGELGVQAGFSMFLAKNVGADISYRWLNLQGNNGLNRIDIDGLILQGRYIF